MIFSNSFPQALMSDASDGLTKHDNARPTRLCSHAQPCSGSCQINLSQLFRFASFTKIYQPIRKMSLAKKNLNYLTLAREENILVTQKLHYFVQSA